jgi:hypothetical protein
MVLPDLESFDEFWKGHHPGRRSAPDVTDGVAQDRKRQEP